MSRSGYSDDCCGRELDLWRGAVDSAIRGKRGQAFLRELIATMNAMPVKRLIAHDLIANGEVCAIGSVAVARGVDVSGLNPDNSKGIARCMGIANALVKEIAFINDDDDFAYSSELTPEQRFSRVYEWARSQLRSSAP